MSKSIFLSHSSQDKNLVSYFVDFLQVGFNVNLDEIYCTTLGDIPTGNDFVNHIKDNISNNTKLVIFLITESYLDSYFCLCEMGAAWVLNHSIYPIIVPPLDFTIMQKTPISKVNAINLNSKDDLYKMYSEIEKLKICKPNLARFANKVDNFLKDLFKNLNETTITREKLLKAIEHKEDKIRQLKTEIVKYNDAINELISLSYEDEQYIKSLSKGKEEAVKILVNLAGSIQDESIGYQMSLEQDKIWDLSHETRQLLRDYKFLDHEFKFARDVNGTILQYRKYLRKRKIIERYEIE